MTPCQNCGDVKHDYDEVDEGGCVNCYNTCDHCGVWAGLNGEGLCQRCHEAGQETPA